MSRVESGGEDNNYFGKSSGANGKPILVKIYLHKRGVNFSKQIEEKMWEGDCKGRPPPLPVDSQVTGEVGKVHCTCWFTFGGSGASYGLRIRKDFLYDEDLLQ